MWLGALLLSCAVSGACIGPALTEAVSSVPRPSGAADSAAVFAAALHAFAESQEPRQLVVQPTLAPVDVEAFDPEHDAYSLWQALVAAQGGVGGRVSPDSFGPDVVVLSDWELHELTEGQTGWSEFYSCYPTSHGLISFSPIGFDPEHRRAMVVVTSGNDMPWVSYAVVLESRSGQWHVNDMHLLLIAIA